MYPIAAIESAMIRRIHEARLPYLRFVGSYGGELLGDWKNVYPSVPAIWVTFAGATEAKALDTARTRFESVLTFTSIAAAYSPRTEGPRTGGPATAGAYAMLTDVARLTAMQDYALDGVDYLRPGRIRSLFSGQVQAGSLAVFAQDWLCRVQARLRAPCERPLGTDAGGYLPPDGQPLPGKAHAGDDPWLPPLEGLALRYWCKPPQDPATAGRPPDPQYPHIRRALWALNSTSKQPPACASPARTPRAATSPTISPCPSRPRPTICAACTAASW